MEFINNLDVINWVMIGVIIFFSLVIIWQFHSRKVGNERVKSGNEKYEKLLKHKKSSEVRLGQISEQLAPFLDLFPYDPKKVSFLGNPIDYVYFGEDKVVIIEVKSGNSRLSKKQRRIKSLVKGGKVEWDEIRIK